MDRTTFLDRLRTELAGVAAEPDLPQTFPATPATGDGTATPERFLAELEKNHGQGRVVRRADLAAAVTEAVRGLGRERRVVVAAETDPWREEIDRGLDEAVAEVVRPPVADWRAEAAAANLGITSAVLGVASTGSVLLAPSASAPRVASLLPTTHLVILPADRLVPGFEEAIEHLSQLPGTTAAPVLVTGPSRTTDIEMVTVYGVHGPRSLTVLLVDESP